MYVKISARASHPRLSTMDLMNFYSSMPMISGHELRVGKPVLLSEEEVEADKEHILALVRDGFVDVFTDEGAPYTIPVTPQYDPMAVVEKTESVENESRRMARELGILPAEAPEETLPETRAEYPIPAPVRVEEPVPEPPPVEMPAPEPPAEELVPEPPVEEPVPEPPVEETAPEPPPMETPASEPPAEEPVPEPPVEEPAPEPLPSEVLVPEDTPAEELVPPVDDLEYPDTDDTPEAPSAPALHVVTEPPPEVDFIRDILPKHLPPDTRKKRRKG